MLSSKNIIKVIFLLFTIVVSSVSLSQDKLYEEHKMLINSRNVQIPVYIVMPKAKQSVPLVVLAHGHGGSKEEDGGFTAVAKGLAQKGIASISMDFPGCGESVEPFTQNNLTNMLADINASVNYMLNNYNIHEDHIGILGFSNGGRVASLLLSSDARFKTAVMWAPSVDINGFINAFGDAAAVETLYQTAKQDGQVKFVTAWGAEQLLTTKFFDDVKNMDPLENIANFTGNMLVINGGQDTSVSPSEVESLLKALVNANSVEHVFLPKANHTFGLYESMPNVIDMVVDKTVHYFDYNLNNKN